MSASARVVSLVGLLLLVAVTTRGAMAGVWDELAKAALAPTVEAISLGIDALWTQKVAQNRLEKETIKSQLEAAKWRNFDDIAAR
jgi:hypothetical protein